MLRNITIGVRKGDTGGLRSRRNISGQMNAAFSLEMSKNDNRSFVHPYKSGKRILFGLCKEQSVMDAGSSVADVPVVCWSGVARISRGR